MYFLIFEHFRTSVRLGEWDITTKDDCVLLENGSYDCADYPVDIPVSQIIIHEGYRPSTSSRNDDIALLRLTDQVTYTDFIHPLCLPQRAELKQSTYDGAHLSAAGWGHTESGFYLFLFIKIFKTNNYHLYFLRFKECNKTQDFTAISPSSTMQ